MRWQIIATAVIALGSWPLAGADGAISATLGGLVNLLAGIAYFWVASLGSSGGTDSAFGSVRRLVRAEALKIMLIVAGLWGLFTLYKGVVFVPLFISFAITALLPGVGFLVREEAPPARQ